jgi:DNA-directed RNA polymerase specialized sigma24 family protein
MDVTIMMVAMSPFLMVAAIVLCYSCGMSHSEASEATGMPLGTVKSHVNRGRAKMQAFFNEAEETVS